MMVKKTHQMDFSGIQGSVLMEMILVIPLYIAFLSGIFLLGELTLGRNHLTMADRLGVWLTGTRHFAATSEKIKDVTSRAFLSNDQFAPGTEIESLRINSTPENFYQIVSGGARLKMVLPQWVTGLRKGALRIFGGSGSSHQENLWDNLSFKSREIDEDDTHTVLMRAQYDKREQKASVLAQGTSWYQEYLTPYIDQNGVPSDIPSPLAVRAGREYLRQGEYQLWSK